MKRSARSITKNEQPKVEFAVETITPAIAAKYLERNTCNRKPSKVAVKRYAADMKAGEWQFNGETIKFDDEGRLIDGQHRLMAIVESGCDVQMAVFRKLRHKSFQTIDTGRNRTGGDVLSICGLTYPTETAAAARLLAAYLGILGDKKRLSNAQMIELVDGHPELADCVNRAMLKPLFTALIPHSQRGFCYYAMSRIDRAKADQFFTELACGLYVDQRSHPIYLLREKLINGAAAYDRIEAQTKLAWLIAAWNAFYGNEKVKPFSRDSDKPPRFRPEPFE